MSRVAETRVFKSVLATLAVLALIGGGFVSYLLLVPVTASNVKFRLTSICAMGTLALRLNEAAAAEMEKLTKGNCGCLSGRLVGEAGPEIAARATEAARKPASSASSGDGTATAIAMAWECSKAPV
jgi:hypothetical protein